MSNSSNVITARVDLTKISKADKRKLEQRLEDIKKARTEVVKQLPSKKQAEEYTNELIESADEMVEEMKAEAKFYVDRNFSFFSRRGKLKELLAQIELGYSVIKEPLHKVHLKAENIPFIEWAGDNEFRLLLLTLVTDTDSEEELEGTEEESVTSRFVNLSNQHLWWKHASTELDELAGAKELYEKIIDATSSKDMAVAEMDYEFYHAVLEDIENAKPNLSDSVFDYLFGEEEYEDDMADVKNYYNPNYFSK